MRVLARLQWVIFTFLAMTGSSGCSTVPKVSKKFEVYSLSEPPMIGTSAEGQEFHLGGLSALGFRRQESGRFIFSAVTDRGPNGEEIQFFGEKARPFFLPEFSPLLIELELDLERKKLKALHWRQFLDQKGKPMTGFPPPGREALASIKYEVPITIHRKKIENSEAGMDSEGYCSMQVKGETRHYVADEYGPSLLEFSSDLRLRRRWFPGQGLPKSLSQRSLNRGFEGLACAGGHLYAIMQSPLKSGFEHDKDATRLIKFDPNKGETVKEFLYPINSSVADKIGDLTWAHKETFFILEQNGKLGREKGVRKVYAVNLAAANAEGFLEKKLLLDLNDYGLEMAEKIEGIALVDDNTLAVVVDNDFGLGDNRSSKAGSLLVLLRLQFTPL